MSKTCSICHRRSLDGVASVYWAWFPGPNTRLAYRTKLCVDCTSEHVVPIMASTPMDREVQGSTTCAACGIAADDDEFYLYATVYMPGRDPVEVEALLCGACASVKTALIQVEGYRLPERDPATRKPARSDSAWALLAG